MSFSKAFLPTVLMFFASLITIIGSLGIAYRTTIKSEQDLSYHLISTHFKNSQKTLDVLLLDHSWWDDAFLNLTLSYDQRWIQTNLASSDLLDNTIHGMAFIKNDGAIKVQYLRNSNVDFAISQAAFGPDYDFIRQQALGHSGDIIKPVSFIGKISGIPALFSISPVSFYSPENRPDFPPENRDFLVFWKILQDQDLKQIGDDLGLEGLKFSTNNAPINYLLKDIHGNTMSRLIWNSKMGKTNLLHFVSLSSIIMFSLLLIGGYISYHRIAELIRKLDNARSLAETGNRNKTEFIAIMSHELRTPLNSIIGFSEVLKNPDQNTLDAGRAEYIDYIHSSGKHLLTIVNEIRKRCFVPTCFPSLT